MRLNTSKQKDQNSLWHKIEHFLTSKTKHTDDLLRLNTEHTESLLRVKRDTEFFYVRNRQYWTNRTYRRFLKFGTADTEDVLQILHRFCSVFSTRDDVNTSTRVKSSWKSLVWISNKSIIIKWPIIGSVAALFITWWHFFNRRHLSGVSTCHLSSCKGGLMAGKGLDMETNRTSGYRCMEPDLRVRLWICRKWRVVAIRRANWIGWRIFWGHDL